MSTQSIVLCTLSCLLLPPCFVGCSGTTETSGGGGQTSATGTGTGTTSGTSTGSATGAGSQTGTPTATGGGGQGGAGQGGGSCNDCAYGMECCGTECTNLGNDVLNCGQCGEVCVGDHPYCDGNGVGCSSPPCDGALCAGNMFCCGSQCCALDELCCEVPGPVVTGPTCVDPAQSGGTCPMGCLDCVCASPDTPIATPFGDVPMATLRVGDAVYSRHQGTLQVVPIARINRTAVLNHAVVRVAVEGGAVLEVSPQHPTADGRTFGDLTQGDQLDGVRIVRVDIMPYRYENTFDILPASDTGTYLAAGMLIGSTLRSP